MSVYLQSIETEHFVKGPSQWTKSPEQAQPFGGVIAALFYCQEHGLERMQILGRLQDGQKDFKIPLDERRAA